MIAQKKPKSILGTAVYHKRNERDAHISHLCTPSYLLEHSFSYPSHYSKYLKYYKHQVCFHSADFTAVKMLIVNLLLFPKALPEPKLFFIESSCPGDTAKPAFDQCLILLDAQGCVV